MNYFTSSYKYTVVSFMEILFTPNGNFAHSTRQLHLRTDVKAVTYRCKGRYNKG